MLFLAGLLISLLTLAPQPGVSSSTPGWELGTRIAVEVPGRITAIRFWKTPDDAGPHIGHVWSDAGVELAKVGFTSETVQGWQEQALSSPLVVTAGQVVTVSVNTTDGGHFPKTVGGLSAGFKNGPLAAPANGGAYGQPGVYPAASHADSYSRDIVFEADAVDGAISITPDAVTGAFTATLKGFQPGPYTVHVTLEDAAGAVTEAARPITIMPQAAAKGIPE
jgi:hypothetical protein